MTRMWKTLVVNGALIGLAILVLIPIMWMISVSFMPAGEASSYPPALIPERITLDHYFELFARLNVARYLFNSLFIAGTVTVVSVFANAMAGYAFAKLKFTGSDNLFHGLLGSMVIPTQIAMIPLFILMKQLGMINTYLGVILPASASIFGIFLIRQYAQSIPDELLDMARVDGATEWRIFWSIVLPVCKPALAALAIFTFLTIWNDFMWPLIMLTDDSMYTLPVALATLSGERVLDVELMMAGSVLTIMPVLILYLFLERYLVEELMAGSIKG